jgi:hypothetical protein
MYSVPFIKRKLDIDGFGSAVVIVLNLNIEP